MNLRNLHYDILADILKIFEHNKAYQQNKSKKNVNNRSVLLLSLAQYKVFNTDTHLKHSPVFLCWRYSGSEKMTYTKNYRFQTQPVVMHKHKLLSWSVPQYHIQNSQSQNNLLTLPTAIISIIRNEKCKIAKKNCSWTSKIHIKHDSTWRSV